MMDPFRSPDQEQTLYLSQRDAADLVACLKPLFEVRRNTERAVWAYYIPSLRLRIVLSDTMKVW